MKSGAEFREKKHHILWCEKNKAQSLVFLSKRKNFRFDHQFNNYKQNSGYNRGSDYFF